VVAPYGFEKVAETGTDYHLFGAPSLNDKGEVAFVAFGGGLPGTWIFSGSPQGTRRLATPGLNVVAFPTPSGGSQTPVINNAGQIVFVGLPADMLPPNRGIDGVYRFNPDGTITTIAEPLSQVDHIAGGPVMNDSGLVAFSVDGGTISELFLGDGTGPVSSRTTSLSHARNASAMQLNNDGQPVVFRLTPHRSPALFFDNREIVADQSPIYIDPDVGAPAGPLRAFNADVGDGGRVVFSGANDATGGLYVWDNGVIRKVPGSNGLPVVNPAINDVGAIAGLVVEPGAVRLSIFSDGVEKAVVTGGDSFDGSRITGLGFVPQGFNDHGQLAFTVSLADGREMVVLATVPEPGSVAVLGVIAAVTWMRRRSRAERVKQ
jgi:hypothetical protein